MPKRINTASAESATVLIVEDNPTQAEELRRLLERNGFDVIAARDGPEALAIARVNMPSVIVSDVMTPKMDDFELCRIVKTDPKLKSIGVILVTALSSPHDVFNGLVAGADNFLTKPYEEEHLVSRIRYLLANIAKANFAKQQGFVERRQEAGIEIELGGQRHLITSGRQQILDLLLSTYEQAAALNQQLATRQLELARSNETLNSLYDLASGFNHCRSEAEVTSFAVRGTLKLPGVRGAWLFLREGNGFQLAEEAHGVTIDDAGGPCACQRLLDAGGLTAADIEQCERLARTQPNATCGHVSIPLDIDGTRPGILNLISDRPDGTFSPDQRRMLASIGIQVSDALQRVRLQEALGRKVEERTRRLRMEVATRRQAERDAEAARERLLDAIECISDGFALYDAEDVLLGNNSAYRNMHASIAELILPGVNFETLVRAGLDCGEGPLVKPSESDVEARLKRHRQADGRPAIQNRGGRWLMSSERRTWEGGVVAVEIDISELKKADIAKDEFLAKVSHELRTPLTPIHGALAILQSGKFAHQPEKFDELVDMAARNCTRLMCIVNDLLDFTRIASGKFSLDAGMIDLHPYLEQVVKTKRIGPESPTITLTVDPRAKGVELEADPLRIQQVIDNLISNAMKFTEPGGTIEVNVDRHNGSLRVSVVDHGPGIPKEFQDRVFDAFSQANSSSTRRRGGVGLGLSICKSIVEAHGGKIGFSSKEGQGTTFFFELPLARHEQAESTKKEAIEGSRRPGGKPVQSRRIA